MVIAGTLISFFSLIWQLADMIMACGLPITNLTAICCSHRWCIPSPVRLSATTETGRKTAVRSAWRFPDIEPQLAPDTGMRHRAIAGQITNYIGQSPAAFFAKVARKFP